MRNRKRVLILKTPGSRCYDLAVGIGMILAGQVWAASAGISEADTGNARTAYEPADTSRQAVASAGSGSAETGEAATYTLPKMVFKTEAEPSPQQSRSSSSTVQSRQGGVTYQLSHRRIKDSASQSVNNSLRNISGVQSFDSTGANPLFYLRGQRASISVNGLTLNQFDSSAQSLDLIPFNAIESVDISPVGNSVLDGNIGIGGQIDITTDDQIRNQLTLSPSYPLVGRDFLSLGHKLGDDWQLSLNQEGQLENGYRDFSKRRTNSVQLGLLHKTEADRTRLFVMQSTQDLQFPGALTVAQAEADPWQASSSGRENFTSRTLFSGIKNRHTFSQTWETDSSLTYRQLWANGNFPARADSEFGQYYREIHLKPMAILTTTPWQDHRLTTRIGFDGSYQQFSNTDTIESSDQKDAALFVMPRLALTETLTLGGGGRFGLITQQGDFKNSANGSEHYNIYAANAYLKQQWNEHYTTSARISRDYQLPFIDQSTITPGVVGSFGLAPETALSYTLSQSVHYERWQASIDAYLMDVDNQIAFNPAFPGSSGGFRGANVNLPPTWQYGLIVNADARISEAVRGGASITWSGNRFQSGAEMEGIGAVGGNRVPGVADLLIEAHTNIHLIKGMNWYLQGLYTGPRYADGDFQNRVGRMHGYFLLNTALAWEHESWRIALRVNNALNTRYNTFGTTFGNGNLFVYPGEGINTRLMVTYDFS